MISKWNGKSKQVCWCIFIAALLFALSGCGDGTAGIEEEFYTCQGFRDWWRTPLFFPYQLIMIDSFENGVLERHEFSSRISDRRREVLLTDITAVGQGGAFFMFRKEGSFHVLNIFTGEMKHFLTGEEYHAFLASKGTAVPELLGLQEFFELRWRELDRALKQQKSGFFKPLFRGSCKRVPLRFPWQLVLAGKSAHIGKFDPAHKEIGKWIGQIETIGIERSFALFKTKEKKTGILIYASGAVRYFSSESHLRDFVDRNFPGTHLPVLIPVEKFHDLIWRAIEKKGR